MMLSEKTKVEIKRISISPHGPLPVVLNKRLSDLRPMLDLMGPEAPEHVKYQAAVIQQLLDYVITAPGTSIVTNVCCAGVGVKVEGTTVYYIPVYVGASLPSGGIPVYKVSNGKTDEQGRIIDWGRMGGPFGWSVDRDLIAGALASFTHNWVGLLALYRDRAKLPQTTPWVLPNMTLAETVAPKQFVLPASYSFAFIRPALRSIFTIDLSSTTPIKIGFDWWDSSKESIAKVESIDLPEGDNRVVITVSRLPVTGYFTINPLDAPQGLTVQSVSTIPRTW